MPLAAVQIITGVILGPNFLGSFFPDIYHYLFNPQNLNLISGIASWGVMIFVMLVGLEIDLEKYFKNKLDNIATSLLCFSCPFILGCITAIVMMTFHFIDNENNQIQLILAVGLASSVTALPILSIIMEKLSLRNSKFYYRVINYASLDDIIVWFVMTLILLNFSMVFFQTLYFLFLFFSYFISKKTIAKANNPYYISVIVLIINSFLADLVELHYIVGAFLTGIIIGKNTFSEKQLSEMRKFVVVTMMPVFFTLTGIKTQGQIYNYEIMIMVIVILFSSIFGKMTGAFISEKIFKWDKGEYIIVGWLLQTKGLIEVIFIKIMLDRKIFDNNLYVSFIIMAIMSTILTMPVILFGTKNRKLLGKLKLK